MDSGLISVSIYFGVIALVVFLNAIFNWFEYDESVLLLIMWPLVVVIAIFILPFYLLHKLGEWIRSLLWKENM
jgi:hypothetical protein